MSDEIPRIDSVWRSRDGRIFRVRGSHKRGIAPDDHIGVLLVAVPPFYPWQKKEVEMRLSQFGPGKFMKEVPDEF